MKISRAEVKTFIVIAIATVLLIMFFNLIL